MLFVFCIRNTGLTQNTEVGFFFFFPICCIYLPFTFALDISQFNLCGVYEARSQGLLKNLYKYSVTAEPFIEKQFISH